MGDRQDIKNTLKKMKLLEERKRVVSQIEELKTSLNNIDNELGNSIDDQHDNITSFLDMTESGSVSNQGNAMPDVSDNSEIWDRMVQARIRSEKK